MIKIEVKDLEVEAIIGTNSHERENKQRIMINYWFEYDAQLAEISDNLEDAIDYFELSAKIKSKVGGSSYFLLEKLAAELLSLISDFDLISRAGVEITKFGVVPGSRAVAITKVFCR